MKNHEEPYTRHNADTDGRGADQPGERAYDIYSRLLKEHIIFIGTPIG